ncbi:MAG TPA: type II secretion system protein [Burkholderiales bacterium]|nr:type II secretion system protein [Burkholderiales bacterium]
MARRTTAGKGRQQGFTLLAMLIAVAATGALLAAFAELTSHVRQREKEAELLFVGHQYRAAIASYYERSPGGAKRYPQKLEDLLKDERYPALERHLRRLYRDPVTGSADWGLVKAPEGGIMGVYSRSEAEPVKTGNFDPADERFADAGRYRDWKFTYSPVPVLAPPAPGVLPGQPGAAAPR